MTEEATVLNVSFLMYSPRSLSKRKLEKSALTCGLQLWFHTFPVPNANPGPK